MINLLKRIWSWIESPDDQVFGPIQDGFYQYAATMGLGRMVASWISHFLINAIATAVLGAVAWILSGFLADPWATPTYGGGLIVMIYWAREAVDLFRSGAPDTTAGKLDPIGDWISAVAGYSIVLLLIVP